MAVLALAAVLGVIGGLLAGGRLSNLGSRRLAAWPLLLAAVAVQAALGHMPPAARGALAAADCAAVAVWGWRNQRSASSPRGTALLGAGAAMNCIVIAANAGMPVSGWALAQAGFPATDVAKGHLYKHVAMSASTPLRFLGDVIPIRPLETVISAGDILMLAGVVVMTWTAVAPLAARRRNAGGLTAPPRRA